MPRARGEVILVVEDDPEVRFFAAIEAHSG